jgi:all-trans-retinol 13,14-reductase
MKPYDVLIIGSGMGGLVCAYILSREGYSVCLVEKNRQLGGNLQIFSRDKVIFDTGVHYLGGLDPGQNLYQCFKYFDILDNLKLRRMDIAFDRITFEHDPEEYVHCMGRDQFIDGLSAQFPEERAGIKTYLDTIEKVCNAYPLHNLGTGALADNQYVNISAKQFIDSCTSNPKLRNVLAGSNPLYAGYPDKTPLYVHALVTHTYIDSAWRCVDGGAQIATELANKIKSNGGTILNYTQITKLHVSDGKVTTAETKEGELLEARSFISNIHPTVTMDLMDEGVMRKSYRNRIRRLENSISVFTLHLVFKPGSFKYLNYNYYHYVQDDVWSIVYYDKKDWPVHYVVFFPATSKSEVYADSMNVMCYMHYDEVSEWSDSFRTVPHHRDGRGASYEDFKQEKAELLLDALERKFPGLRTHIKSYTTTSPLSYRDYIGTSDGSMYGIRQDYNSPLTSYVHSNTKIPNLFLTGQNLNLHGILGVTISALRTCGEFVDLDALVSQINKA